jgi:hypothetical protein
MPLAILQYLHSGHLVNAIVIRGICKCDIFTYIGTKQNIQMLWQKKTPVIRHKMYNITENVDDYIARRMYEYEGSTKYILQNMALWK